MTINEKVKLIESLQNRICLSDPSFKSSSLANSVATQTMLAEAGGPDLWKILHVSPELKESLEEAAKYIEFVAKAVSMFTGGIDFANSALKLMGLVPGPEDQFEILFNKLKVEIQKVHSAVVQASLLENMQIIDTSYAKAKSAAQAVSAWVRQGKPLGNDVLYESAKQADVDSRQAINELMMKSRWLRLFDINIYKTNGQHADDSYGSGPWWAYLMTHPWDPQNWNQNLDRMSDLVHREEGDFVWDYRLALPAYLYAVCARLTVLQAHYPDFNSINQTYSDEINEMVQFLKNTQDKVTKGFWNLQEEHWKVLNSASLTCPVFFADIYTGQFAAGQMLQDYNFITNNSTGYGQLLLSRYMDINSIAVVPILSAIADLLEIKKWSTNYAFDSITSKYHSLGKETGFLGVPTSGITTCPDGIGSCQHYQNGSIYYHPKSGAWEVHGDIRAHWFSLGSEKSILGYLVTDELANVDGNVRYNHFQGGSIYWSLKRGAHEIHGYIKAKYAALGWEKSPLGIPVTDEKPTSDGIGRYNDFQAGSIYWSPSTGACVMYGIILNKYLAMRSEKGLLGYPVTDEQGTSDGIGTYIHFQGGSIFWTPPAGAHEVHGYIKTKYAALGWEKSILGYPLTDEMSTTDGSGRYNHFQGGSIYWSASTGAFEVHGDIRARWSSLGWETSFLGFPLTDEMSTPDGQGRYNDFQGGSIYWYPSTGAYEIPK